MKAKKSPKTEMISRLLFGITQHYRCHSGASEILIVCIHIKAQTTLCINFSKAANPTHELPKAFSCIALNIHVWRYSFCTRNLLMFRD